MKRKFVSGSNKRRYYLVAKILHWLTAFVVAFNILSGWKLGDFALQTRQPLVNFHADVGVTIFFLMLFRWWWREHHKLFAFPGRWKRPSTLVQLIFYPLVLIQVMIGAVQAAFIDYEVIAFGFINFSAIAADNEGLHELFLLAHGLTAGLLIVLIVLHGLERSKKALIDDQQFFIGPK